MDLRKELIDFCNHGGISSLVPSKACSIEELVDDYLSINCDLDETQTVRQNEDAESDFYCEYFEKGKASAKCNKPCVINLCYAKIT